MIKGPPAPPATLRAEQNKWQAHPQYQQQPTSQLPQAKVDRQKEEPWDLLKQMEGIKIVSGRPRVNNIVPVQRTKMEFKYPTIQELKLQQEEQRRQEAYIILDPHLT